MIVEAVPLFELMSNILGSRCRVARLTHADDRYFLAPMHMRVQVTPYYDKKKKQDI
jgi:hypothetical protein